MVHPRVISIEPQRTTATLARVGLGLLQIALVAI